jgi:hypothetical protein
MIGRNERSCYHPTLLYQVVVGGNGILSCEHLQCYSLASQR